MKSVSLSTGTGTGTGTEERGLAELDHHMPYEHREVRDGVVGEGQDLSEEDESRINAVGTQDVSETHGRAAFQTQPSVQKQHQQLPSQGSVVRWERFLPLRSLKVLLVETDDSTRHVVSALLRNCSYEVTAVSNGIQAWKILRDLTNHIDLVLTEVIMPDLSGIALLCKIMNHKTCKNIPVIMMSSHDSMGIVFKCLSKGAVDFLVKPIRKNELKNLWQHVWRRCHSSSGSGSESGIQLQKSPQSNSVGESDDNSSSNDVGDNVRDGSDNGSGTQSSWTKRAVDVDSPQPTFQGDQVVNPTDSTCAQVIHSKPEFFGNKWMSIDGKEEHPKQDDNLLDNIAMGKALRNMQHEHESKNVCTNLLSTTPDGMPAVLPEKVGEQLHNGLPKLNCEKPIGKLRTQLANQAGSTTHCTNPQVETVASEALNGLSELPETKDKTTADPKELPSLELSLERPRVGEVCTTTHEPNVLRHSYMSAFSRYNTTCTTNQVPTGNVGSCSPLGNSSETMKTESTHNQQSNESSNNIDMGSTTKNIFTKPVAFNEKSTSTSTERYIHSAFRPVQNGRVCLPLEIIPPKNDVAIKASVTHPRDAHQQVQVQHHHHHYHHHHHHVHNMQQQPMPDNEDLSLNETAAQGVPVNVFGGKVECNGGSYSLNASACGSNNGSNKDVNANGTNNVNDIQVTAIIGAGGASGNGSGSGVDQNQLSQRVAALTKFRQKRKERCFQKKVRYQSRKRLAEQRPRVRGQFVRQRVCENNGGETGS